MKTKTLTQLNNEVALAKADANNISETSTLEERVRAREALRKAQEAVRVFSYKAKRCLTKNGKVLRP